MIRYKLVRPRGTFVSAAVIWSHCLAFVSQVGFSVFSPKGAGERRPFGFLRLAAVLAVLCLGSAGAWAATCTVNLKTDTQPGGVNGELRYCLNNFSAGDTINFSVTGEITLTGALPAITQNVTITGPGANQLTISGSGSLGVFTTTSGTTVNISGLKISGGNYGSAGGGAINSSGSLTVTGCEFANNSAATAGGAIVAAGSLTVSNSTFTNNSALDGTGGAIDASAGLVLANSTFSGNSAFGTGFSAGGAVYAGGTVTITNNTFYGNTVQNGEGNAIALSGTAETIDNNLFVNNSGAFTIYDFSSVAIASNNVFYGNSGADCPRCATNSNGVDATANPLSMPLTYYGGLTRTFLPQPGGQAICAGSASLASAASLTTDQRGFAMDPTSYTPCAAGSVDAGAVQANYIQVQANTDAGAGASDCQGTGCTLRDAVLLANSNGYGDIDFASGVSSITLSSTGTLELSGTTGINIIGPGASTVTVNGGGGTSNFSVFTVDAGVPASLYGLTISNGNTSGDGGGISNSGTLTVVDSTISGNSAANGGGIANSGTLQIAESTVSGNSASSGTAAADGGGVWSSAGTLSVVNSTIAGNSVSGNAANGDGGGIFVAAGSASLANTVVSANTTNGADANIGGTFTDGGGNVIGGGTNATNNLVGGAGAQITLSALQLSGIGATVQTMIPLPGSPAICAGESANIASGLSTDERGYPLQPTGGYCPAGTVDSGAVQTNYTSVSFVQQPSTVALGAAMSPAPTVNILETDTLLTSSNTDAVNGVPITLTYSGTGTLSGNTATTAGGVATFSSLEVSTNPGTDVTLGASVPVTPSGVTPAKTLTATPSTSFNVIGPAKVLLVSAPASTTAGVPFSVTVTAEDAAGNTATGYAGTVHFTSSDPGTALVLPANYTFVPATDQGVHTFTNGVALVTVGAGSQTVTATDTVTGSITGSATVTVSKANSAVTMTAAGAAIDVNGSVTFTATVAASAGSVTIPFQGTMSFASNGTTITGCSTQSVNASTGMATCTTTSLLTGPNAITATYSGDANYNASPASASTTQTVNKLSPTLVLTSPSASAGMPVTLTATLGGVTITPNGPTGTVSFSTGGNPIVCTGPSTGTMNATTGVATCTTSALVVPADVVAATYNGDSNYNSAVATPIPVSVAVSAATISFLPSSPTSGAVNQPLTFTVKVAPPGGGGTPNETVPTGSVTFKQGTTTICNAVGITGGNSATGTPGTAACTYSFTSAIPSPGVTISAVYSGDQNFSTGSSNLTSALIVSASGTTATLSSTPASSTVNQQVAFTAVVAPTFAGTAVPTGTVTFVDNTSTTLCTKTLSGGVVPVCDFTFASAGSNSVVANYSGDTNFNSTSSAADVQVVGKTSTSTAVASLPSASAVNQTVTFTATITSGVTGSTNPTGTVAFSYVVNGGASVSLCAAANVSTTAGLTTAMCAEPLPADGNYTISAVYSGDPNFAASTGTELQPVGLAATTTAVVASSSTSTVNQSVTFTATVTPTISGSTNPTGTVTFSYTNSSVLTPVNLCAAKPLSTSAGKTTALCVASLPATAADTITATYSGDGNFATSSGTSAQTVNTTGTTTAVSASTTTPTVNQAVIFTATITPAVAPFAGSTNPSGQVAFSYTLGAGSPVTLCASAAVSTTAEVTTATCSAALPSDGSYTIKAAYTGDTNFITSTGTAPESVGATATTTTVVPSSAISIVNQAVTFTATVAPAVPGSTNPTGTVAFSYSLSGGASVNLCTSAPVSTVGTITTATCTDPLPTKGPYTIKATYLGDPNFSTSFGTTPQTVNQASTTTAVVSSLPTAAVNQAVTFTATVTPAITPIAGSTNPTGSVAFTYVLSGGSPVTLCASATVSTTSEVTTATCTGSLPANGNYTITAAYGGDPNFVTSSGTIIQPVGLTATTTSVVSSLPSSFVNEAVTFTATVTSTITGSTNPTGTVAFAYKLGGLSVILCPSASLTTTTGVASCTAPLPSAGSYSFTATYSGDKNFAASSNSSSLLTQTVNQPVTTVGLTSSLPTSSVVNQPVIFTATINPVNTGTPTYTGTTEPTGTVTFTDTLTGVILCTETVTATSPFTSTGSVPPCSFAFSSPAANTITATYSGDGNFPKTTSTVVTQTVNQSPSTTTVVSSNPDPSVNQAMTFTATVAPTTYNGSVFPTGTVTFSYSLNGAASVTLCASVGVTTLGTVTTATCTAPLPAQASAAAPYTITAAYSGDTNFTKGAGTTTQVVAGTRTTTTVIASPSPSAVNQQVTFTATVTPAVTGSIVPTGSVTFTSSLNGGAAVNLTCKPAQPVSVGTVGTGTAAVTTALCTAPLPAAGSYVVTASYGGDANFGTSAGTVPQTVSPANLTLAVISSTAASASAVQATSSVNQPLTFTATLALPFSAVATPTSTVTFNDTLTGATLCSDITVVPVSGLTFKAACSPPATTPWVAATHSITATYNGGDPNFPSTTSPVFKQVVTAVPATATVVSSMSTSVATQTVTFTAKIIPTLTGPVLPSGTFQFTTTGLWAPSAPCPTVQVNAISSGTGAGTATAICTVQFPATAQSQTITATYGNDANFTVNSSSVAQTVQNFTFVNSVTSNLSPTATTGPVYLTQGYSTVPTAATLTDPFNPTKVQMVVTSTGGFTDTLDLGCKVTSFAGALVTDPSCTVSATASGANGTAVTYTVASAPSATTPTPVGLYTVTLTADDNANPALSNSAALAVYIVGEANVLSLAQGASGQESVSFNTFSAPQSDTFTSVACGTVVKVDSGVAGAPIANPGVTCTSQIPAAGIPINSGKTTTVAVSISTSGAKTAELRRSGTMSLATLLGVPLLALMGWVGSRKSPRRNFFRFLGLILLLVGVSYASGCGGSFTSSSTTTTSGIGPGSYLVQVVGTDQNGSNYYAAIPLDVSSN
jgi:hypothetical protein